MGKEAKEVREGIWAFMSDLGIELTPEQHDKMKKLLVAHANAQAEDLLKELAEVKTALERRKNKK